MCPRVEWTGWVFIGCFYGVLINWVDIIHNRINSIRNNVCYGIRAFFRANCIMRRCWSQLWQQLSHLLWENPKQSYSCQELLHTGVWKYRGTAIVIVSGPYVTIGNTIISPVAGRSLAIWLFQLCRDITSCVTTSVVSQPLKMDLADPNCCGMCVTAT